MDNLLNFIQDPKVIVGLIMVVGLAYIRHLRNQRGGALTELEELKLSEKSRKQEELVKEAEERYNRIKKGPETE